MKRFQMEDPGLDLDRLRQYETDEWKRFYDLYAQFVFRVSFRWSGGNRELAKETTQEVFLLAAEGIKRYRGPDHLIPNWLYGIARNILRKHFTKLEIEHRHVASIEIFENDLPGTIDPIDPDPLPDAVLSGKEQEDAIAAALQLIPYKWEYALRLRYYEDLSHQEIGNLLGISEKGAESLIRRARNGLREAYLGLLESPRPEAVDESKRRRIQ